MRADQDVVPHAHAAEQRDILEGAADAQPRHAVARHALERTPLEQDIAVSVPIDAADAVEQRGLAGPVGADQAADLAVLDVERDAGQRDHAAEAHGYVGDEQQRGIERCHHTRRRGCPAIRRCARNAPTQLSIRAPQLTGPPLPGASPRGRRSQAAESTSFPCLPLPDQCHVSLAAQWQYRPSRQITRGPAVSIMRWCRSRTGRSTNSASTTTSTFIPAATRKTISQLPVAAFSTLANGTRNAEVPLAV